MIEVILLAGSMSIELEPYAVENHEPDDHGQETNADASGKPFQWTTQRAKSSDSLHEGTSELDNFGNRVDRDGHKESVEMGE